MDGLKRRTLSATLFLLGTLMLPSQVSARGRMMEPAQRSSLFSRGFNSPINDDDSALNCGGAWRQHELNGGKCGVCGDPYDAVARENEPGGKYANGIIANTYTTNDSSILVVIDIQSFLKGYFEFRICPHNNVQVSVQQTCLDRHQLKVWDLIDNQPQYQYYPKGVGLHRLRVELPVGMMCTQCVLQWKWHTGTNWGRCRDGMYKTGCGPQEEYYNCADIAIVPATDLEYSHALPLPEQVPTESQNDGMQAPSEQTVLPWKSISFVSHDSNRVINFGQPEITEPVVQETITEQIVPVDVNSQITTLDTASAPKTKQGVVVLPYNGANSETVVDTTATDFTTDSHANANANENTASPEPMTLVEVLNNESSTDGILQESMSLNGMSTVPLGTQTQPKPTAASTVSLSTSSSSTKEAITRNFDIRTFTGITTPNMSDNLKVFINSTEDVINGTSYKISAPNSETATQPFVEEIFNLQDALTEAKSEVSQTTEPPTPVPIILRSSLRSFRKKRAVPSPRGPPPPPPPAGSAAPGSSPMGQPKTPDPSPSAMYDPTRAASTLAQKEMIMQQQISSGNTMSGASIHTANLGAEMMGVEALGEPGRSLGQQKGNGPRDQFPASPDPYSPVKPTATVYSPGPPAVPDTPAQVQAQSSVAPVAADPAMAADPAADAVIPYEPPRIPRPPEVSAAEIEASIADTPVLSSAVSDTGKSMDASSILGTSYIPGLNEAASNLAETSTASRQGTMIVQAQLSSPANRAKSGGSVEYLSPTQGTSIADKPSETVAQVPDTKFSSSLGFMPTPEQIMSGMRGVSRPVPADTTNLEPTGPAPPDPNAQSTMETKEALIRQLGEAMGIISGNPQQAVPEVPPQQAAQMVPDLSIATVLAMATGQTSAGPLAISAEAMAAEQMPQTVQTMPMESSQSQALAEQAMFQPTGNQESAATLASPSEMVPGVLGKPAGQMGTFTPEMIQALAKAGVLKTSASFEKTLQGLSAGDITSVGAGQGTKMSMGQETRLPMGPDMIIPQLEGTDVRTSFGPDMVIQGSEATGGKMSVGPDMVIPRRQSMGPDMVIAGSEVTLEGMTGVHGRQSMGADMVNPRSDVTGGRMPIGPDIVIPEPQSTGADATLAGSSEPKTSFEINQGMRPTVNVYREPMAPTNNIIDKSADILPSGANLIMDKTMLQNLMRMRLSPEMMNWVKYGGPSPDIVKTETKQRIHKNIIKRNTKAFPTSAMQQSSMTAMTGTSSSADGQANRLADKTAADTELIQQSSSGLARTIGDQSKFGISQGTMMSRGQIPVAAQQTGSEFSNIMSGAPSLMGAQASLSQANQQSLQADQAASVKATNKQADLMMTMGRLFGASTGPLGGRIMGDANTADMSSVKYETAKKEAGQAAMSVTANKMPGEKQAATVALQTDTGVSSAALSPNAKTIETSSADQMGGMTELLSLFAGMGNQVMGTFGFSGMGQSVGRSAAMSEVVSGSADMTASTKQEANIQPEVTSDIVVNTVGTSANVQASTDSASQALTAQAQQGTADTIPTKSVPDNVPAGNPSFTPIGGVGSGSQASWAFAGESAGSTVQLEQQWSWDPAQQAWVLISVPSGSDAQPTANDVQMQTDVPVPKTTDAPSAGSQTSAVTSSITAPQQAIDSTKGQGAVDLTSLASGQADQSWAEAGYRWDAATNAYVPITPSERAQSQVDVTASQSTSVQSTADISANQGAATIIGKESTQTIVPANAQSANQADQSWEQAGYTWDAATNAYVPKTTVVQPAVETSQAVISSETVSSVDKTAQVGAGSAVTLTGSADVGVSMSASAQAGVSESIQVPSIDSPQPSPVEPQRTVQIESTVYEPPGQQYIPAQTDLQPQQKPQPNIGSPQEKGATTIQGTVSQGTQSLLTEQAVLQQQSQQADYTQVTQQQAALQAQQAGVVSNHDFVQAQQQQAGTQDAGFQNLQQADMSQRSTTFSQGGQAVGLQMSQASETAQTRAAEFSQTAQQPGAVRGPLMTEAQQWEQQAGILQQVSQQQSEMGTSGVSQTVTQQQTGTDSNQMTQVTQQQSQQVDTSAIAQTVPQQQPVQTDVQMAQVNQQQWQQMEQNMDTGASPPYQTTVQQTEQAVAASGGATSGQVSQQWTQQQSGSQTGTASASVSTSLETAQPTQAAAQVHTSFTPVGQTGAGGMDATAFAWQAVLAAAQAEAQKALQTRAQTQTSSTATGQAQTHQPMVPAQPAAQETISWEQLVKAATAQQQVVKNQQQLQKPSVPVQQPSKPQVPAWAVGFQMTQGASPQQQMPVQPSMPQQLQPQPQPKPTPPAQPQKKAPIRPDPVTRAFVRDMFIKQMSQGADVNPLNILIGLTPELLMKSGVNPRIAKSGDAAQIVPAVERALGISLRRRSRRPGGRPSRVDSIGGVFADPMGGTGGPGSMGPEPMGFGGPGSGRMGPGGRRRGRRRQTARDRALQRRKFMMEQRMITEIMGMLGLGPEPLEPGDPGYRAPRGGAGAAGAGAMGPADVPPGGAGMGGMSAGGMPGMGGGTGAMSQQRMMLEALGF